MTSSSGSFRKAATARNFWRLALKSGYNIRIQGESNFDVPAPVIVLVNDAGPLTTPITRASLPWPAYIIGVDISLIPPGLGAVQHAAKAIEQGRSIVVRQGWIGGAALALLTGATIVAMRIVGAQARIPSDPVRPGSHIQVFGARPRSGISINSEPTAPQIRMAHERLRQYVADSTPTLESA